VMYFRLFRGLLFLATGAIFIACTQKPSTVEPAHTADPPRDDRHTAGEPQIGRFASQHGALGHYYDGNSDSFVLIFPADVTVPPREQIAAELKTRVRVERVEMTKGIYSRIESDVARLHSRHRGSTYALYLDLPTARAVLISDLPSAELEPLIQKYPDLVEFKAGSIRTDIGER
jgi:hypothetical protein